MKTKILSMLAIMAMMLSFTACSDDDDCDTCEPTYTCHGTVICNAGNIDCEPADLIAVYSTADKQLTLKPFYVIVPMGKLMPTASDVEVGFEEDIVVKGMTTKKNGDETEFSGTFADDVLVAYRGESLKRPVSGSVKGECSETKLEFEMTVKIEGMQMPLLLKYKYPKAE